MMLTHSALLALATSLIPFSHASHHHLRSGPVAEAPQLFLSVDRTIAGVSVLDTPLIRAAQTYASDHGSPFVYKHIMRSWLFGALVLKHNTTLSATVDREVHAVAALLHDLGWDQNPTSNSHIVSPDRRFEVDGAIAARDFLKAQLQNNLFSYANGKKWTAQRIQLVWDAIALHTQASIAYYKEPEVEVVAKGIAMDFQGPGYGVTREEYARVLREFPNDDMRKGVNETIIWLCGTKPGSTFGELLWSLYLALKLL
ncbi:hypothetical protein QBC37DRAFT_418877 [Rhypophila decipiens]|uniref:HD domain-containing protein n=1 Tax=Rhypophila decipiens TaxID=261697 RepID=A0AAN7BC54_9PEZI|nr:hypothetical protein QBC37DRAFT_418877 [Rhypophila decipiens]